MGFIRKSYKNFVDRLWWSLHTHYVINKQQFCNSGLFYNSVFQLFELNEYVYNLFLRFVDWFNLKLTNNHYATIPTTTVIFKLYFLLHVVLIDYFNRLDKRSACILAISNAFRLTLFIDYHVDRYILLLYECPKASITSVLDFTTTMVENVILR